MYCDFGLCFQNWAAGNGLKILWKSLVQGWKIKKVRKQNASRYKYVARWNAIMNLDEAYWLITDWVYERDNCVTK